MTTAWSELDDNQGRCERSECPNSRAPQRTYPLLLAGFGSDGNEGWGTIWLCDACAAKRANMFTLTSVPQAKRWLDEDGNLACGSEDLAALETAKETLQKLNAHIVSAAVMSKAIPMFESYAAGVAAAASQLHDQSRIRTAHERSRSTVKPIQCVVCKKEDAIEVVSHRELEGDALSFPVGWRVRPADSESCIDEMCWCSAICFDRWAARQEVQSAWIHVRPRALRSVHGLDMISSTLRAQLEAEFEATRHEHRANAIEKMVAAFGPDWQTQGGLTDAEIA